MGGSRKIFISYAWCDDSLGRSNYDRVQQLGCCLKDMGWDVWIDADCLLAGNIDAAIMEGIESADVFLVCLTQAYCKKVQESLRNPHARDSCAKEWSCAMLRQKLIQPIIMEPSMRRVENWPHGVITAQLGNNMYVDCSGDVEKASLRVHSMLRCMLQANRKVARTYTHVRLPPILTACPKLTAVRTENPLPEDACNACTPETPLVPTCPPDPPKRGRLLGCGGVMFYSRNRRVK